MTQTLDNLFCNNNNIIANKIWGMLSSSPSPLNTSNIFHYSNSTSPLNDQESGGQESQMEEETPKLYLKFQQNSPKVEKKGIDNDNGNDREIPGNTSATKNTTNGNISDGINIIPVIENIVCTANLNCRLNLKAIALQANNVKYEPKKFSGLIMKIKEPKATALIFQTGKMVCLGTKNEEQAKTACKTFAKIIKKIGYKVTFTNFKIQNIVGSCNLNFRLPLSRLGNHIMKYMNSTSVKHVAYLPDLFPGLIYHYLTPRNSGDGENGNSPNIVFLIFNSGKIVITGAKKTNQIYDAFSHVYPLFHKFRGH